MLQLTYLHIHPADQTAASMPATTDAEKDKVAAAVAPQLKELEVALTETTALIKNASQNKRSTPTATGLEARSCSDSCLVGKANGLVTMITGTVTGLVGTLGVGEYMYPFLGHVK